MIRTVNFFAVVLIAAIALFTAGCAGKKASPIDKEMEAFGNLRAESGIRGTAERNRKG